MLLTHNVLKKWHSEPTPQFIQPCELSAHFPVWKCFWQRKSSKSWGTPNLFGDEICMIIVFVVWAPIKCFMQSSGIFWWFVPRVTFVFIFVQVRVCECIHCNYEWGRVQVSNLFVTRQIELFVPLSPLPPSTAPQTHACNTYSQSASWNGTQFNIGQGR